MAYDSGARSLARAALAATKASKAELAPFASALSRAPGASDGAAAGFAADQSWLDQSGGLWRARRVAGRAVWQRQFSAPPEAGDSASGLVAAYGTKRLVSAYGTGPGIDVVRASDAATLTVNFLPGGGLDVGRLRAFLRNTTGRVSRWYDQSGNGHHATQATDTNRPLITPFSFVGDAPGVFFDSAISSNGSVTNYTSPGGVNKLRQFLTLPATLTGLACNSLSVVSLASMGHSHVTQPIVELSPDTVNGGSRAWCMGTLGLGAFGGIVPNGAGTSTTTRSMATNQAAWRGGQTPCVSAMTGSGSFTLTMYGDDRASYTINATGPSRLQGGMIGGTTLFTDAAGDGEYGYTVQGALMVFNVGLTAAQYGEVRDALYAGFRVPPQRRGMWFADGDSITHGAGANWFQSWPRQAVPLLNAPLHAHNVAIAGARAPGQLTGQTKWLPFLAGSAEPVKLASTAIGSNDLFDGRAAAALYTDAQTWVANVLAAAPAAKLLLGTIIPRANLDAAKEAQRIAYNDLLRANWKALGCAGLIDMAADPTMAAAAVAGGSYDATLLLDGTHPTTLGYGVMAGVAADAVNAALAA